MPSQFQYPEGTLSYDYRPAEAGKPTLLFIHGNSLSGATWPGVLTDSSLEGFGILVPDLPGHGASSPSADPANTYTLTGLARVLIGLCLAVVPGDVVAVGHSLGGHIAIEMAALGMPGLIGMTLFGAPPIGIPPDMSGFLPHRMAGLNLTADLTDEQVAIMAEAICPSHQAMCERLIRQTDPQVRAMLGASLMQAQYADEVQLISTWERPIQVLHGTVEPLVSLPYLQALTWRNLYGGRIELLNGAGHSPNLEMPGEVYRQIAEFAAGLG